MLPLPAAGASFEAKTPVVTQAAGNLTVSGLGFSISLMWRDGDDLPVRPERWGRDGMYEERVSEQRAFVLPDSREQE